MLIQGSAVSERTNYLIKEYVNLLEKGVDASEILVLTLNSFKKNFFINSVKTNLNVLHYENPKIYTFYGLVYNTVKDMWPIIENSISTGDAVVFPNLTGLEISQIFFKSAIKDVGFKDYNSKINLMHQLFRRYSLITNNNLSDEDVEIKSKILKESFAADAHEAIDLYKKKTVQFRAFDYIRQVNIFNYLYKNTDYFKNIKYLILDDADEITSCEYEFVKYLKPQLKGVVVGYDKNGSSRLGFLNTDINTVKNIETLFDDSKVTNLDNIGYKMPDVKYNTFTRRLEMIYFSLGEIKKLINAGVNPESIAIVTPIIDKSLKFAISDVFDTAKIKYQYFSGSEKLSDTPLVKDTITLLKWALFNDTDLYKIRSVINNILKIPVKYCLDIVTSLKENSCPKNFSFEVEKYNNAFKQLSETIETIKDSNVLLSEKIICIYKNLVNLSREELWQLKAFNFFVKQVEDFETVFMQQSKNPTLQKSLLNQLENSIISENPSAAPQFEEGCVVISTSQKLIDFSVKTKYQFWLDVTSDNWNRDDYGTLYNAWVFQKSWDKQDFTYEDNIRLSSLKIQKQLRKLSLLNEKTIFAYSSFFDAEGNENFGGIEDYICNKKNEEEFDFQFEPREDQKPVLAYEHGNMSVSAVPGAGKTTILLALIIKLLKKGIKSENIFVLTYMDSAARNFKERIKKACPSIEKVPNISTIHGLALRILKENSNYVKVGLNNDFEVCDDNLRQKIIREIMSGLAIDQENFDKYEKAISILKLSDSKKIPYTKDQELRKFLDFYTLYNKYLKNRNIIDYDDMLALCVRLLEENSDIAAYYQNLCQFVIEDEAQDSSSIQQKLLNLLCKKYNNLVRCGDINQAITTTFTNADLEGFKNFINNSLNITMSSSQRCAKEIYSLANDLIDFSLKNEDLRHSFYNIKMQGVEGKNPESPKAVNAYIFENYKEEQEFLLESIRKIFAKDKNASVAVLVRNNYHIESYLNFLSTFGYKVITKNDTLQSQPIFALIYAVLEFCAHPWQNDKVLNFAYILNSQKIADFSDNDFLFIKNSSIPFIMRKESELQSKELIQFLWDLNYWLECSCLNLDELALKVGNYYYSSELERSNVYMVSLLFKNLAREYPQTETLLDRLELMAQKPLMNKFKFFASSDDNNVNKQGLIQIMTYHKSKGDEFDYVFIPQLSEDILPLNLKYIKIKSKERFLEAVKVLSLNYIKKDEIGQKRFIAEENLRLFYVAVTRAKKRLYISCAKKYKNFSKLKDTEPSIMFNDLLNISGDNKNEC